MECRLLKQLRKWNICRVGRVDREKKGKNNRHIFVHFYRKTILQKVLKNSFSLNIELDNEERKKMIEVKYNKNAKHAV